VVLCTVQLERNIIHSKCTPKNRMAISWPASYLLGYIHTSTFLIGGMYHKSCVIRFGPQPCFCVRLDSGERDGEGFVAENITAQNFLEKRREA
jgi:hypothetical protein